MIWHRNVFALALVLGTGALAFGADRLELRDGRTIVGDIVSTTDGVVSVRTTTGIEKVLKSEVLRIRFEEAAKTGDETTEKKPETSETPAPRRLDARPRPSTGDARADAPDERTPTGRGARTTAGTSKPKAIPAERRDAARALLERAAEKDEIVAGVLAVAKRLEDDDAEVRGAAAEEILTTWPQSRAVLAIVFNVGSDTARLEATILLRDERMGDTSPLVRSLLGDPDSRVRIHALRAVYTRRMVSLEKDVLAVVASDATWGVRQEAARALERIGGITSFQTVVSIWKSEEDVQRRRRLKRVLRAIAGADLGDDPVAWEDAVAAAFVGDRILRDPSAGLVIQKPESKPEQRADDGGD